MFERGKISKDKRIGRNSRKKKVDYITFNLLSKKIFWMSETTISKMKKQIIWENHHCNMTGEELIATYKKLLQINKKKDGMSKDNKQAIHKNFK